MKIAIIEDDLKNQKQLKHFIEKYHKEHNIPLQPIDLFSDGINIVGEYHKDYDVLYFDIQMNILDGLEAAKIIRERDSEVLIVFITNYVQWAIDGYKVNAYDFLLKPLSYFAFSNHYDKLIDKINLEKNELILSIKTNDGLEVFPISKLKYIESRGHYLNFITTESTFTALDTLKKFDELLQDSFFYRINNSFLINMNFIDSIAGNDVIIANEHLPISRGRKKEFLKHFNDYVGNTWL